MPLLLGIVLVLIGGAAVWAGITGNQKSFTSLFGLAKTVDGTGSVAPRSDGYPHGTPWPDGAHGKNPISGQGDKIYNPGGAPKSAPGSNKGRAGGRLPVSN